MKKMKKIVRLTESDLTRIVRKVIKEQASMRDEFLQLEKLFDSLNSEQNKMVDYITSKGGEWDDGREVAEGIPGKYVILYNTSDSRKIKLDFQQKKVIFNGPNGSKSIPLTTFENFKSFIDSVL